MNTLPELQAERRRLASEQRELRDKIKAKERAPFLSTNKPTTKDHQTA